MSTRVPVRPTARSGPGGGASDSAACAGDRTALVDAALALEYVLKDRKYNPQCKLLLIKVYCLLGTLPSTTARRGETVA